MSREEGGGGLVGFLLGAAVGAGVGLLLAPRSGKETREKLADWLDERREKGSDILHKIKETVPEKAEQVSHVKDQIVAAVKAGKEAFAEAGRNNIGASERARI
jgi:gas vesicle protein